MPEQKQTLAVFAHMSGVWTPAGRLTLVESGIDTIGSSFAYGLKYIRRPDALPIVLTAAGWLPDRNTLAGIEFYPGNDLALFGAIRDAAPDAWGRRVIEARFKVPANSLPESCYLLEAGANRAGALDIRADLNSPPTSVGVHRLDYLLEAAERIEAGLPIPQALADIFQAGSGMGGMRPKASVVDAAGQLWLAKFPSQNERLNIPVVEEAALRLAGLAGLNVPETRIEMVNGKAVMLIRRFDRAYPEGVEHRHHMISALTLLGCHERESIEKSYVDIADALRQHGALDGIRTDLAELFGRMVFNILVTNDDDHLRNHALLWDQASNSFGWRLSPLYDVVPRPMVATERYLHLSVGSQGRLATIDNAMTMYARFGLDQHEALEIIDRIWRVVRQWRGYFEDFKVPAEQIDQIGSAFRHIDTIWAK